MNIIQEIKRIPELNFILLCSCVDADYARRRKIKNFDISSLNWDIVFEISVRHRVFPLFYKNIKKMLPNRVPDKIIKKFKNIYFNNATKSLYYSALLIKLIDLLQELNIFAVPFKGPVLAQDIHNNLELRQFSDLDILVSKNDAVRAWSALVESGYQPGLNLDKNQKHKYIDSEDHIAFTTKDICIELHWEMSGLYIAKPLIFENILKKLEKINFSNRKIPNICPEHLLVYLCIHGAKHGWGTIEPVCCVAGVLKKNLDWNFIKNIALTWKCQKMLNLGLYLSWTLLDADVPDCVLDKIKKDTTISRLSQEVVSCMFNVYTNSNATDTANRFSLFHFKIRDSFTEKVRYFFRLAFRPTDKEWFYFPVPGYLSFLHFLLRPCRLVMEILRKQNA